MFVLWRLWQIFVRSCSNAASATKVTIATPAPWSSTGCVACEYQIHSIKPDNKWNKKWKMTKQSKKMGKKRKAICPTKNKILKYWQAINNWSMWGWMWLMRMSLWIRLWISRPMLIVSRLSLKAVLTKVADPPSNQVQNINTIVRSLNRMGNRCMLNMVRVTWE